MELIKAIPHIRLQEANQGKLAALDAVWLEYQALCEQYLRYFCTEAAPDGFADYVYVSRLSARWQRVAVQQAAGIARAWRTNRDRARAAYDTHLFYYEKLSAAQKAKQRRPDWTDWRIPELHAVCIQANVNVVKPLPETADALHLTPAERSQFDYWLQIATLQRRQPIFIPVKLAEYHRQALAGHAPNGSVTLNRRKGQWWLTLSISVTAPEVKPTVQVCGGNVGIVNFLTDDAGQHYGSFRGDLSAAHQRDRAKRQRKAQLRACLEKKGVTQLPATSSATGQRLARRVRQDINRAVNEFLTAHPHDLIAVEDLSVATMCFQAKRMNAYLYASNLAHIPKQLAWRAAQCGIPLVYVNPAYSSQECPHCHFADRANRPTQQTFCCQVCGYTAHADVVGAANLAARATDSELTTYTSVASAKRLLVRRHAVWRQEHGYP